MIRRCVAALAALTLLIGARAMAVCVVQTDHMAALVSDDGARLAVAEAAFELIDGALYAVGRAGDYALCDARGEFLGDARYEMLEAAGDVLLCRRDGRYGALDLTGEVLIPPEWAALTYAGEGAFLALEGDIYDDQPDELIFLDSDGARQNTGSLTQIGLRGFHDGRMAFMLSDGHYGYVDNLGRQVIPPQWRWAGDFADGVAVVSDAEGMGLIDAGGRIVVPPQYVWMQRGESGIAGLSETGTLDVWSPDGARLIFALEGVMEASVCGDDLIAKDAQTARVYDASGACVFEASPEVLFFPGLDGQLIVMDGPWGGACQYLLNPDGSAASGRYQRILPLCAGRYAAMTFDADNFDAARYGLLSADGRELLPAEYRRISRAGENRLALETEDAVIFADTDGNALCRWPVSETAASSSEADA